MLTVIRHKASLTFFITFSSALGTGKISESLQLSCTSSLGRSVNPTTQAYA